MATRYWVGGTATWDATVGTKWALTSGGAGGQAVPTVNDDVFIDAVSSANTISVSGSPVCRTLDFKNGTGGAFAGTIAMGGTWNIYGSLILSATMTFTTQNTLTFGATTTGWVITTNGKAYTGPLTFSGANGGWTVTDNLSCGVITRSAGALVFQGNVTSSGPISSSNTGSLTMGNGAISCTTFAASGNTTRTLTMNGCTLTMTGSGVAFDISGNNLTWDAGTSKLIFTTASPTVTTGGRAMYDVDFQGGAGTIVFTDSNSWHNFTITPSGLKKFTIWSTNTQTIAGVIQLSEVDWVPFSIAVAITPATPASDNYSPATFTTSITLSCVVAGASNVTAQINDKSIDLINTGGNNWSKTIYAGYFGSGAAQTIYFTSRTDGGATASASAPSTITIPAITAKTATLLSEVTASLTAASIASTCSLIGEEVIGSSIRSLVKISVATYAVATIDAIRTAVAAAAAGWSGTVTAVEYSAPVSTTNSIVIYKMSHT